MDDRVAALRLEVGYHTLDKGVIYILPYEDDEAPVFPLLAGEDDLFHFRVLFHFLHEFLQDPSAFLDHALKEGDVRRIHTTIEREALDFELLDQPQTHESPDNPVAGRQWHLCLPHHLLKVELFAFAMDEKPQHSQALGIEKAFQQLAVLHWASPKTSDLYSFLFWKILSLVEINILNYFLPYFYYLLSYLILFV